MNFSALVVTTVYPPTDSLRQLASACGQFGIRLIIVGDQATPADFHLSASEYYDLRSQYGLGFRLARSCPTGCYARKNIGYLIALAGRASLILESDDDTMPLPGFFDSRRRYVRTAHVVGSGWANMYSYFTTAHIWPRGFPLDAIRQRPPGREQLPVEDLDCPIQQGLVAGDPDVDAIYRLVCGDFPGFDGGDPIAVGRDSWCPVNSQNTAWWTEVAPLLYLPAHCSFRMTDIWRGLIAQRIAWENGWSVLFHSTTARQSRNPHDLMRDFKEEIPGYLRIRRVSEILSSLSLSPGVFSIPANLRACYTELFDHGVFCEAELPLLEDWLADCRQATGNSQ